MIARLLLVLLAMLALGAPALAVQPDEQLPDPRLEARAVRISAELRCVVCQNESIDESDATLAHDLRVLLRERLKAGDTDAQATGFIVARYGHYVLLKPPFEAWTLALWLGPLAVLLAGGGGVLAFLARRNAASPLPLSDDEQARLDRILQTPEGGA